MNQNVFCTRREYVDPANHTTDLVRLDGDLNPLEWEGVDIFLKVLHQGVLTGKGIPMSQMVKDKKDRGELDGVHTFVIPSSGNAAIGLSLLAPFAGDFRVVAVVPDNIPPGKRTQLKMSGAEIVYASAESPVTVAKRLGRRKGWLYFAQYDDPANAEGHRLVTASQILDQLGQIGRTPSAVCFPMGTSGAKVGIQTELRRRGVQAEVWGVAAYPGESISGMKTRKDLKGVGLDWRSLDFLCEVHAHHACFTALRLFQGAMPGGLTAGAAVWAALSIVHRKLQDGSLGGLRNAQDGRVLIVVPAVDPIVQYWKEVDGLSDEEKKRQPMPLPPPA